MFYSGWAVYSLSTKVLKIQQDRIKNEWAGCPRFGKYTENREKLSHFPRIIRNPWILAYPQ